MNKMNKYYKCILDVKYLIILALFIFILLFIEQNDLYSTVVVKEVKSYQCALPGGSLNDVDYDDDDDYDEDEDDDDEEDEEDDDEDDDNDEDYDEDDDDDDDDNDEDNDDNDNDEDDDDNNDEDDDNNDDSDDEDYDDDDVSDSDDEKALPKGLPNPEQQKPFIPQLPMPDGKLIVKIKDAYIDKDFFKDWITFNRIKNPNIKYLSEKDRSFYLKKLINCELMLDVLNTVGLQINYKAVAYNIECWRRFCIFKGNNLLLLNQIKKASLKRFSTYAVAKDALITYYVTKKSIRNPTSREIAKVYLSLPYNLLHRTKKRLSHIMFCYSPIMSNEEKKNMKDLATNVLRRVATNPALFNYHAKKYSGDLNSSHKGGNLGWFTEEQTKSIPKLGEAYQFFFKVLKKGQVSCLIFTSVGISILKVNDVKNDERLKDLRKYIIDKHKRSKAYQILNQEIVVLKKRLLKNKDIIYYYDYKLNIPKDFIAIPMKGY